MALDKWEVVENEFAFLFKIFVESASPAASRAYGAIASSSGRRDALEQAAEIYFRSHVTPEEKQDKFVTLLKHLAQASTRRNEIAHGMVVHVEIDTVDEGSFLVPADYNSRKTEPWGVPMKKKGKPREKFDFLRTDYRYVADDIVGFHGKFLALFSATSRYASDVSE